MLGTQNSNDRTALYACTIRTGERNFEQRCSFGFQGFQAFSRRVRRQTSRLHLHCELEVFQLPQEQFLEDGVVSGLSACSSGLARHFKARSQRRRSQGSEWTVPADGFGISAHAIAFFHLRHFFFFARNVIASDVVCCTNSHKPLEETESDDLF